MGSPAVLTKLPQQVASARRAGHCWQDGLQSVMMTFAVPPTLQCEGGGFRPSP